GRPPLLAKKRAAFRAAVSPLPIHAAYTCHRHLLEPARRRVECKPEFGIARNAAGHLPPPLVVWGVSFPQHLRESWSRRPVEGRLAGDAAGPAPLPHFGPSRAQG